MACFTAECPFLPRSAIVLGEADAGRERHAKALSDRICSGPQNPLVGGFLVARAPSLAALQAMFEDAPFHVEHLARYSFREFEPVKRQPWTEAWFSETSQRPRRIFVTNCHHLPIEPARVPARFPAGRGRVG